MATISNTTTVKYASRAAVNGSNAYDLNNYRGYGNRQTVQKPLEEKVISPFATPAAKPAALPAEKQAVRPSAKTVRKPQRTYGLSLFAVAGFTFVVVMVVFLLLAYVKFNEVSAETAALQTKLDLLNEEERKLKIAYEDAFDVNEVEAYATNVLGMTKMTDTQVETIQTATADKAVVVGSQGDDTSASSGVVTFLMSLVAYFK